MKRQFAIVVLALIVSGCACTEEPVEPGQCTAPYTLWSHTYPSGQSVECCVYGKTGSSWIWKEPATCPHCIADCGI
jgi:hypothetical protein